MSARKPILLVEDEEDIADACRDLLEDAGYTVVVARDGREALAYLEKEAAPCLVLLDLLMPEVDGLEFLSRYQQLPGQHPPVVIATAAYRTPAGHQVLRKPYDMNALLDVVHQHAG
ncbi:MAG: response regulator [Myxococcota bacterium]|nr:response regulator [Myxococcota bacterium]